MLFLVVGFSFVHFGGRGGEVWWGSVCVPSPRAWMRTWKQSLYLRTWKQRLYFLTGTNGTYGDSHFKASNDFLCSHQVLNVFSACSLSSQCVPNCISLCPVCFAQTLSAWNICRWQDSGTHIFSTPAGFCYMCINWEEGRWQRTVGGREVESKKLFMNASIFRIFLWCANQWGASKEIKIKWGY